MDVRIGVYLVDNGSASYRSVVGATELDSSDFKDRLEVVCEPIRLHRFMLVGYGRFSEFFPISSLHQPVVVYGKVIQRDCGTHSEGAPFVPKRIAVRLAAKLDYQNAAKGHSTNTQMCQCPVELVLSL